MRCFECKIEFGIENEGYEMFYCDTCCSSPGRITTQDIKIRNVCGKCVKEIFEEIRKINKEAKYLSATQVHEILHHSQINII